MRHIDHLLIGISSGALIYFSNLSFSLDTVFFFIGIAIGSVILNLDGNSPRKYHNNPILFWLASVNYFLVYPIIKSLSRKRELKVRDASNVFTIAILAFAFYCIFYIIDAFLPLPFNGYQFVIGILFGGLFLCLAHLSTPFGAKPFFPIWKMNFFGKETSWKLYDRRLKWLIIIPSSIVLIGLLSEFSQPGLFHFVYDLNLVSLLLIWIAFLYSSGTFSSIKKLYISRNLSKIIPKPSIQRANFLSDVEKFVFEELNKERRKNGLHLLQFDNSYANLSREHSHIMAKRGKIFHGNNVTRTHGSYSGENCAMMLKGKVRGFKHTIRTEHDLAKALHKQWMTSPGHRANILNSGFNYVGIGVFRQGHVYYYATQLFSN
jgi:uncharacterized protein YkwD